MKLSNALLLSSVVGAVGQQTFKIRLKENKTCVGEPDAFPNSTKKGQCKKKCMKKAKCKGIRFENRPKDGGPKCGHYMENDVKMSKAPASDDPKYKVWCGKKIEVTVPVTPPPTSAPTDMPSEAGKYYNFQEGYACGDKAKQKLKDTESRLVCKKACDDWEACFAFEWVGEDSFCGLYNDGMKTNKIKNTGEDDRVCALVVDKTDSPTSIPSSAPSQSLSPSISPSLLPSTVPSAAPSYIPSSGPSAAPSSIPSTGPSEAPSSIPSLAHSSSPSTLPSLLPSTVPSAAPSYIPSSGPSAAPSSIPSTGPSEAPSSIPSLAHSSSPSTLPSLLPSIEPSSGPSDIPTDQPSLLPSSIPSDIPSDVPSDVPSSIPSLAPSSSPSESPSLQPSKLPTLMPTVKAESRVAECTLDLKLGYPHGEGYYDDDGLLPGLTAEAPYYGVHKDYMTITDGTDTCAGEDRQTPAWCTYKHTWEPYDETDDFDPKDYYGAQHYYTSISQMYYATAEYMTIEDAAGKTFIADVYHAFEKSNYYYEQTHQYYGYQYYDHLMAAHLSIEVEGTEIATGLHHDHANYYDLTDDDKTYWAVNTHDENGEINPDYDGHFEVEISCDNACSCTAEYST